MNLSNQDVQLGQNMYESSASQKHPLGTRGYTQDGRAYRYCQAGAADLIAGTIIQSPAVPAGQNTRAVNTTSPIAIGATSVNLTCGSTVAAGFYNEGYLVIASGTGQGYIYQINNHAAVSTGATGVFTLYAEDALVVAITISSTVSLVPNKYRGVIIMPATTATGILVGVATYIITTTQYGWIQTWGPAAVYGADTNAIGSWVTSPATACGQGSSATAASLLTGQVIGHLMRVNVAQEFVVVDLTISP